jgi:hypothetical protein
MAIWSHFIGREFQCLSARQREMQAQSRPDRPPERVSPLVVIDLMDDATLLGV